METSVHGRPQAVVLGGTHAGEPCPLDHRGHDLRGGVRRAIPAATQSSERAKRHMFPQLARVHSLTFKFINVYDSTFIHEEIRTHPQDQLGWPVPPAEMLDR